MVAEAWMPEIAAILRHARIDDPQLKKTG